MEVNSIEMLGYLASAIVALSFLMKNMFNLRVVNFVGCVLFAIYGLMIESIPVMITNGFIASVNVYFLLKMRQQNNKEKL